MNRLRIAATLLPLVLPIALAALAAAQMIARPDQKDMTLDVPARAAVIDTLVARLNERYVFTPVAKTVEQALRQRQARREYDRITSAMVFADSLTAHVQAASRDRHLRVRYREEPIPAFDPAGEPPPEEQKRARDAARRTNYGFQRVERMGGNVGYLDLRGFAGVEDGAGPTAVAAMNFLAHTDALIVDLRRNGGGNPEMIQLVSTYLFPEGERTHLNDLIFRDGGSERVGQYHTFSFVPGPRYLDKPVYVLTSHFTFSGAEEYVYNLQNLKRATVVGEVTGGGANPGGMVRLSEHFAAFVPSGRARNPISQTNWEGTGVRPDVAVAADSALRVAHTLALRKLLEKADDADYRTALERALGRAEAAPIEPFEDPRRGRGRL